MDLNKYCGRKMHEQVNVSDRIVWIGTDLEEYFLQAINIYDRGGRVAGGDVTTILSDEAMTRRLQNTVINYYGIPPQDPANEWKRLDWQERWAFAVLLNQAPFSYCDIRNRLENIRNGDDLKIFSIIGEIEKGRR